jgi:hypothetical protein
MKDAYRIAIAMARVVVGYAPNPALPGFPALFSRLKEVYELVVAARSALAAGATHDVESKLSQAPIKCSDC